MECFKITKTTSSLLWLALVVKLSFFFFFSLTGCKVRTKSSPCSRPVIIWRFTPRQEVLHLGFSWRGTVCYRAITDLCVLRFLPFKKHHAYVLWFCLVHESQDDDEVGGMGKSWDFAWLLLLLHQLYITNSGSSFMNSVIVAVVVFFWSAGSSLYLGWWKFSPIFLTSYTKTLSQHVVQSFPGVLCF